MQISRKVDPDKEALREAVLRLNIGDAITIEKTDYPGSSLLHSIANQARHASAKFRPERRYVAVKMGDHKIQLTRVY